MVNKCHVALGANLATSTRTPLEVLGYALRLLEGESFDLAALSKWYSTPAFPAGSGPDYVNAVAAFDTNLDATGVLQHLNSIEASLGRVRHKRWDARVCDLDLLNFDTDIVPDLETYMYWRDMSLDMQLKTSPTELILPHPRLQDRAFVLIPLRDVAPDWKHPVTGAMISDLIDDLLPEDRDAIKPLEYEGK